MSDKAKFQRLSDVKFKKLTGGADHPGTGGGGLPSYACSPTLRGDIDYCGDS